MKITHVHLKCLAYEQQRVGKDTPADVMAAIRWETIKEDPPGKVLVLCPYREVQERFEDVLLKDRVDVSRVKFLHGSPIEKEVSVAGKPERTLKLVTAKRRADSGDAKETVIEVVEEETPTHKEKITIESRFHIGDGPGMRAVKRIIDKENATLLVIVDPNEHEGDLKYLPQLLKACHYLDVVIYHRYANKWGVVYEGGDADPDDAWDTKSEVENEDDLPWVIKHIAHRGESTWFGALPKVGKTWVLLCIVLALLTGLPLFGDERFKVAKAKRVIYLCPEAGRGSIKKRLKLLGLVDHLYDPITNPDGALYLQTLSKKKIALTDPLLLGLASDADIFIDTAVRYLEGSENDVEHVKVLTENVLNLLSVGARSVWVAHHSAKGFENANTMTLGNMFRGSGEFGAAGTNFYGLCTEDAPTTTIRLHCICGRDLDELIPDMILQGRPHLSETGNFRVVDDNAEPFTGGGVNKPGPKEDPRKEEKIRYAKSVDGSGQVKTDAVNAKFGSKHGRRTIERWLEETLPFDTNKGEATHESA